MTKLSMLSRATSRHHLSTLLVLSLCSTTSIALAGVVSESETNDDAANADAFDDTTTEINGSISSGDVDFFAITLLFGETLTVTSSTVQMNATGTNCDDLMTMVDLEIWRRVAPNIISLVESGAETNSQDNYYDYCAAVDDEVYYTVSTSEEVAEHTHLSVATQYYVKVMYDPGLLSSGSYELAVSVN